LISIAVCCRLIELEPTPFTVNNNGEKEDLGTYDDPEVALEKLKSISTAFQPCECWNRRCPTPEEFDKSKNKILIL
jgi:hypothetical protein